MFDPSQAGPGPCRQGTTTAMSDASGRFLVALETSVTCLKPIPFERQAGWPAGDSLVTRSM